MELVGWTNDRLVLDRIARRPDTDCAYEFTNSSIVFVRGPTGMRFNAGGPNAVADRARIYGHHTKRTAKESTSRDPHGRLIFSI